MFQGKMKALTFSYDDAVTQDIRLIELFDKYGMKATFNLNSDLLGKPGELIREVAVHTLGHPNLRLIADDQEVIRQVEEDRLRLSDLCGYEVTGMAYPCGGYCYDPRVIDLIRKHTGVKYARTTNSTYCFAPQTELLAFHPSVHHHSQMDAMFELGEQFLQLQTDTPQVFYVWGHAYEFDIHDDWARFEEFLQMMHGKADICYCTNREALLV